jgi:hypothetical protein
MEEFRSLLRKAVNRLKRLIRVGWLLRIPYLTPLHLTNSELVQIMRICFSEQFEIAPSNQSGEVSLKFRRKSEIPLRIEFWFTVTADNGSRNFAGFMSGNRDFVSICIGLPAADKIIQDWEKGFSVPSRLFDNYMKQIGYFTRGDSIPKINPLFKEADWKEIYTYSYGKPLEIRNLKNYDIPT